MGKPDGPYMPRARRTTKQERSRTSGGEYVADADLAQMLGQSPAVLYCLGPLPDHPTTFISQNVIDQLGYTPPDFYTDPFFWKQLLHPDDSASVLRELSRINRIDRISYEYRLRHRDGHYLWVHDQLAAIRDPSGQICKLVGSWFDVTDRKRIDVAMMEQTRLVEFGADVRAAFDQKRAIAEILHDCAEAMVGHLNAAFARIWTLNKAENILELQASAGIYTHLDGKHSRIQLGALKIGQIAQERKPHLTNAVVGDPRINNQAWARREGMVAFAGYPLLVEQEAVGVMAMFSREPITEAALEAMSTVAAVIALGIERKRAEEAIRRSERLVSIGTLAAGIAHEINNPITAIYLTAQRALSPKDLRKRCQSADECFGNILRDAERCDRIIKNVLQFSRTRTTEKRPNKLADIVRRATNLAQEYAKQKGAIIKLDVARNLPRATVNSDQIVQALLNLIRNAVESGGVGNRVEIRAKRAPGTIRISVSDQGCGMTNEQRSHIFDPFYTTRDRDGGTGLGLSIVHGIVLSHAGRIDVESQLCSGTTITIELPLAQKPYPR